MPHNTLDGMTDYILDEIPDDDIVVAVVMIKTMVVMIMTWFEISLHTLQISK